jgi:hypothetical protein
MNVAGKKKIVLLGMMTRMPVAGVVWQNVHYLLGLERLGYDVYYVEDHTLMPTIFMADKGDDPVPKAAAYLDRVLRRWNLGDRWCLRTRFESPSRVFGLSEATLRDLYQSAHLIINLHGGTLPQPEHYATDRLVFLETDPVQLQIELYENDPRALEYLKPHCAFFTFGENWGSRDCGLPVDSRFKFHPTRQPVIMDLWEPYRSAGDGECFTTVGNWVQPSRVVTFRGQTYHWSKHYEFMKIIDLPRKTLQPFELALASYQPQDQQMLEGKGWRVRNGLSLSKEEDPYREYICQSRGEFTVAKDQNVRLRSGWFSDRSATYLAAGRPVITQDTGFDNILPEGQGLFAWTDMKGILRAIDRINSDYAKHSRIASQIAREYFNYDVVLPKLLKEVGV